MRIESSAVALHSHHVARRTREVQESLRVSVPSGPPPDRLTLSSGPGGRAPETGVVESGAEVNDPNLAFLQTLLEYLTGHRIRVLKLPPARETPAIPDPNGAAPAAGSGFSLEYDYRETRSESEQTRFAARGVVRTADGREIAFTLDVSMQREWREQIEVRLRAGEAVRPQKDPLVLVYDGPAAQLTDAKYEFDLDADGRPDSVSFTAPGSAFLAFDRNGDGRINDGSELFGPATGDGFAELAAHDSDGNGWIDEGDPVFAALRLYETDAQGADLLSTLADRDVGALYLGAVATPFELRGADNASNGTVRQSGIYLKENGVAGALQQLDLSV